MRNGFIDIIKFIYAIVIVLLHSHVLGNFGYKEYTIMGGGYVAVELFFIISGFLMAKHLNQNIKKIDDVVFSTLNFIKRKIEIILPFYLVAFFICFFIIHIPNRMNINLLMEDMLKTSLDFFLLTASGLNWLNPVGPAWYISAMLFTMLIFYPIMISYKNKFTFIFAPILVCFLYGFILQTRHNISAATVFQGFVYVGVLRSIAGIALGCICYEVSNKMKNLEFTKIGKALISFIEVGLYSISLYLMQKYQFSKIDFIIIFMFAVAVTFSFSEKTYTKYIKSPTILNKLSLNIYLVHGALIGLVNRIFIHKSYIEKLYIYIYNFSINIIFRCL